MGFLEEPAQLRVQSSAADLSFPFPTVPGSLAASKAAKYGECYTPAAPLVTGTGLSGHSEGRLNDTHNPTTYPLTPEAVNTPAVPDLVVHTYNPSSWKVEAGGYPRLQGESKANLGYRIPYLTHNCSHLQDLDPDSFHDTEGMSLMLNLPDWAASASVPLCPLAKELWGCGYSLCRPPQASSLLSCQHDFAQYAPA